MKYFVTLQQDKGKPFLCFYGKNQDFLLTVHVWQQKYEGRYRCFSMATMAMRTRHNVTFYVSFFSCYYSDIEISVASAGGNIINAL
jgi:hypothetical protein